jgi:hypothetical protein
MNTGSDKVPFGMIFSTFMVWIMIGSVLFKNLRAQNISFERILLGSFITAAIALITPCLTTNEIITFIAFNAFEFSCGIYFPAIGSLRSNVIPEETRSTVMNLFRIPLNIIVVVILLRVEWLTEWWGFVLCSGSALFGALVAWKILPAHPEYDKVMVQ